MVMIGCARKNAQGNLVGDIAGGTDKVEQEVHPIGGGSRDNKGIWVDV